MIKKMNKNADRRIRHARVRKKVFGTSVKPRLCVYRSTNYIYAQIIDDVNGNTLCASSSEKAPAAGYTPPVPEDATLFRQESERRRERGKQETRRKKAAGTAR